MNFWAQIEEQFQEQIAGIPMPAAIPQQPSEEKVRREATPVPMWKSEQGHEL